MAHNDQTKLPFFRSLRGKLLIWFLALALIPLGAVAVLAYLQAQTALQQADYDQLAAVQAIKKNQIETYFQDRENDITVLGETVSALRKEAFAKLSAVQSLKKGELEKYFTNIRAQIDILKDNPFFIEAFTNFDDAFAETGQIDSAEWQALNRQYSPLFNEVVTDNGWHDLLFISPQGDIIYTVEQEEDLGLNIDDPKLKETSLATAYQKAQTLQEDQIVISDFAPFEINGGIYEAFLIAQIRDESQTLVGYLATELPIDQINAIVQDRNGMGRTGETYLVSQEDDGRITLRSDMITMGDGAFVVGYDITDIAPVYVTRALAGEVGQDIFIDSNENPVLVAYEPLAIEGFNWAMISKIDAEEALVPHEAGSDKDFFTQYIELHGYHDLFLINSEGFIFYSVIHEPDYRTSLVTGPYSNSNLGHLTQQVLETKSFGFADFAPYAPSGGEVDAFMAQPVLHDAETELIVAVQLPLEDINGIMQERTGMGQTGETYLVGSDMRMRSDSFLNPETHTVSASFNGSIEENGVDTVAAQAALAGETGTAIIDDYRGQQVLSAFAPVQVEGLDWAILAEIDEAEAFAEVNQLRNLMLFITGVTAAIIVLVALWIANSLASPISKITQVAQAVTQGNLQVKADVSSGDETGILANAFNRMIENLRKQIKAEQEASEKAAELAEAEREQKEYLEYTVDQYLTFVEGVAAGDLSSRLNLNGNDDVLTRLGYNLNTMVERLGEMTNQIREATSNIASAAAEILAATTQQASGANEQSSAISQTTTTIDEVKTIVEQAFAKAQNVAQQAQKTRKISETGEVAVSDTVEGMNEIKERVEGIAENILALSEQTQQIGEIIATVNEIASQSNLLALNASVEAARAGEHGKGFAVVAVEVRNLAEQSKQATAQVKSILNEIQRATNAAVMATEEGTKGVESGAQLTEQTGDTIKQLAGSIDDSANAAQQIVASAQQQTTGMEQIALAMQNINQATVQNLASTRQAEKAAQDLSALAQQMERLVAQYKLN